MVHDAQLPGLYALRNSRRPIAWLSAVKSMVLRINDKRQKDVRSRAWAPTPSTKKEPK